MTRNLVMLLLTLSSLYPIFGQGEKLIDVGEMLNDPDSKIIVYCIPFSVYTRIPVTKEYIRKNYYAKVEFSGRSIIEMAPLMTEIMKLNKKAVSTDIRILFDIIHGTSIVFSTQICEEEETQEISQIFNRSIWDLLGISPQ